MHDDVVNEVLLLPRWNQLNDERHTANLRAILAADNIWISSLDMEVHWLAEHVGSNANLISPGAKAIELTAKPEVKAFADLGFAVPEFIFCDRPESEIHAFLRNYSWQCWLKSPYHEAKKISSWTAFIRHRGFLAEKWKSSSLFLQRHVTGNEESLCFAAYQGELVAAIHLEKRQVTAEGKTWAGKVTPLEGELLERLRAIVRQLEWSGGGELEFTRDPDGKTWIIECNPRFPAWIHGAALAGQNLPGKLIAKILDLPFAGRTSHYPFFTRVVREIPAKESVGIAPLTDASQFAWSSEESKGKGGSMQVGAAPRLKQMKDEDGEDAIDVVAPEVLPALYLENLESVTANFQEETPCRAVLERWTRFQFQKLADSISAVREKSPELRIGYSVKTSPTETHLQTAKQHGFLAECISQLEINRALASGFSPDKIILNGPGKFWPATAAPVLGMHMVFCDSIEEFGRATEIKNLANTIGFRIRFPGLPSRFGVSIEEYEDFQRILNCLKKWNSQSKLGFHFHMASCMIGVRRWTEAFQSLLVLCRSLEQLSGRSIECLDLGGGFYPADLARLSSNSVQDAVAEALPGVKAIYFEPGRALTQDTEALVSRILDVRKSYKGEIESIVVDASIAELPLARTQAHKIFYRASGGTCKPLGRGKVRVLGRICMEDDILAENVDVPNTVKIGDLIIFGDSGAYDRSMSYEFGRG